MSSGLNGTKKKRKLLVLPELHQKTKNIEVQFSSFSLKYRRSSHRDFFKSGRGGLLAMKIRAKNKRAGREESLEPLQVGASTVSTASSIQDAYLLPNYIPPTPFNENYRSHLLWTPNKPSGWSESYSSDLKWFNSPLLHYKMKLEEIKAFCQIAERDQGAKGLSIEESNDPDCERPIAPVRTAIAVHIVLQLEPHIQKRTMGFDFVNAIGPSIYRHPSLEDARQKIKTANKPNVVLGTLMKGTSYAELCIQLHEVYSDAIEFDPEVKRYLKEQEKNKEMEAHILTSTAAKWKTTIRNVMFKRWKEALEGEKLARQNLSRWLEKMVGMKVRDVFEGWKQFKQRSKKNRLLGNARDTSQELKIQTRNYNTVLSIIEEKKKRLDDMNRMYQFHQEELQKDEDEVNDPARDPKTQTMVIGSLVKTASRFMEGNRLYASNKKVLGQIQRPGFGGMRLPFYTVRASSQDSREGRGVDNCDDDRSEASSFSDEVVIDEDTCISRKRNAATLLTVCDYLLQPRNFSVSKYEKELKNASKSLEGMESIERMQHDILTYDHDSYTTLLMHSLPGHAGAPLLASNNFDEMLSELASLKQPIAAYFNESQFELSERQGHVRKTFAILDGEKIMLTSANRRHRFALLLQLLQVHGNQYLSDRHAAANEFWGRELSEVGEENQQVLTHTGKLKVLFESGAELFSALSVVSGDPQSLLSMDSKKLFEIGNRMNACVSTIEDTMNLLSKTLIHCLQGRTHLAALTENNMFLLWDSLRPHLLSRDVMDEEDQDDGTYTVIRPDGLVDLFKEVKSSLTGYFGLDEAEQVDELDRISAYLRVNLRTTKRMFTYYAGQTVGGSNASMDKAEYFRFIKDCKLAKIPKQKLEHIFQRANGIGVKRKSQEEVDDSVFNPDNELVGNEFLEALLRLSCLKYKKNDMSMSEKLINFFEDCLIPNAGRIDSDGFRGQVMTKESLSAFKRFDQFLRDIFIIYAAMDQTDDAITNVSTINETEFVKLIRDIGLMSGNMSEKSTRIVFAYVQAENDETNPGENPENTTSEMVFTEFLEAVGALAALHNPDPYIPLSFRIEQYISNVFRPAALKNVDMNKAKSKRKNLKE